MTLAAPAPIGPAHDLAGFDCGDVSLNDWLALRALANQASGATRTYVVAEDGRVVAYYALASGALAGHVLDVLLGKTTEKIERFGHHQLGNDGKNLLGPS